MCLVLYFNDYALNISRYRYNALSVKVNAVIKEIVYQDGVQYKDSYLLIREVKTCPGWPEPR